MSGCFLDVFAKDELPVPHTFPVCLVVNTHPRSLRGEHWVAMYFEDDQHNEFFESYGFPPDRYTFAPYLARGDETLRSFRTLQALTSDVCGHYCLFYLYHRTRVRSLQAVVNSFRVNNRRDNDRYVVQFVNRVFGSPRKTRRETGGQCCKTMLDLQHGWSWGL